MPIYKVTFTLRETYTVDADNEESAYCSAWEDMIANGYFESSVVQIEDEEDGENADI